MPGYKKTQSTEHVFNLTSGGFCLLLAFIKNRMLPSLSEAAKSNRPLFFMADKPRGMLVEHEENSFIHEPQASAL